MNHDFQIKTTTINAGTKWERIEKVLTYTDGRGDNYSMPIYEDTNVEELINSLSKF